MATDISVERMTTLSQKIIDTPLGEKTEMKATPSPADDVVLLWPDSW